MQILWFIPTGSHDGRYLGTDIGSRVATPDYLQQIAQAVDTLGYTGALLPTGSSCEDAWITAATFISVTKRMKFLVAIRPGITSPGAAARMTATFDRISKGRLLINVATGEDPVQLAGDVIVRETESAAWDAANELIKYVDEDAIAKAQENLASSDSEGQRRMSQLHQF